MEYVCAIFVVLTVVLVYRLLNLPPVEGTTLEELEVSRNRILNCSLIATSGAMACGLIAILTLMFNLGM